MSILSKERLDMIYRIHKIPVFVHPRSWPGTATRGAWHSSSPTPLPALTARPAITHLYAQRVAVGTVRKEVRICETRGV